MVKNILLKMFLMFFGILLMLSIILPVKRASAFEVNSPELGMMLSYGGNPSNLKSLKSSSDNNSLYCDVTTNQGEFISGNAKVVLLDSVDNRVKTDFQKNDQVVASLNINNIDVFIENVEYKGFAYPKPELTPKINGQVKSISCTTMKIW